MDGELLRQMDQSLAVGIQRIVLVTGPMGEQIVEYVRGYGDSGRERGSPGGAAGGGEVRGGSALHVPAVAGAGESGANRKVAEGAFSADAVVGGAKEAGCAGDDRVLKEEEEEERGHGEWEKQLWKERKTR